MKSPNYKGIELLPLSVIKAARAGDAEAVERVLRYYEGYINKLCTRTLYDGKIKMLCACWDSSANAAATSSLSICKS